MADRINLVHKGATEYRRLRDMGDGTHAEVVWAEGSTGEISLLPNGTQADERLTVSSAAVQFATSWHADTSHIEIDVQSAPIMVTFDNSAPTASNGHRYETGDHVIWPKAKATAMKAIRAGGTDAVLHASQMTT